MIPDAKKRLEAGLTDLKALLVCRFFACVDCRKLPRTKSRMIPRRKQRKLSRKVNRPYQPRYLYHVNRTGLISVFVQI
jgi:hypothetical protein